MFELLTLFCILELCPLICQKKPTNFLGFCSGEVTMLCMVPELCPSLLYLEAYALTLP